jgi:ATP-binding cassette subfamily B protein
LLVQQIIDAVITQGNLSSLNVLGTLLVGLAVAQAVLGSLRTYLFSDTTNRIDISLGSTIIDHLLRLPLGYFARRPVGEVSSRINELEKIRSFLTGTALTVVLDALFSLIYIAVMLLYSVPLTLWALAVVPLFIGVTAVSAPVIRHQLRDQAEANARVQSSMAARSRRGSATPSPAPPPVRPVDFWSSSRVCWCCGWGPPWCSRVS